MMTDINKARIVFDLDGTLIDSAPDIGGIANAVLKQEGAPLITMAQTRDFIGNGAAVFVEKMRLARNIPDDQQTRLLEAFMERYETAFELTVPYPGVVDALDRLRAQGHRLGICTNKPLRATQAVLNHLSLDGYFETVLGGDSLPVSKPDPAPLVAAFDALGSGPRVYVGDSEVDAAAAQAANVPFLLFTEGYRKSPVNDVPHTRNFDDFDTLPSLVDDVIAPSH